jgi:beta-N-acetylhexosaminidase
MTAHIRVPALDDVPATLSRALLEGVLRGELGFEGVVVTDALEMRGVSETIGVEEAAVRSLAAGADALLLGHDLGADALERIHAALTGAVRSGRLGEDRLAAAAGRLAALGGWTADARPVEADRSVGAEAAQRALRVEGDVTLGRPPLVVELSPAPTVAAGPAAHGFGGVLRSRLPEAEVVTLQQSNGLPEAGGRQLVLVLRDAHRHAWERDAVEQLLAGAPDAIVVETGLPVWRPAAAGFVATHGAGRVNLEAAAARLLG